MDTKPDDAILCKTSTPLEITQGELKVEKGISLVIYRLANDVEEQVHAWSKFTFFIMQ